MVNIGGNLLGTDWDIFKSLMADVHATFAQKIILWKRSTVQVHRYGEDPVDTMVDTQLAVLCDWNYKRTWPVDINNESGQDDEQSVQIYLNKEFLRQNGFLNTQDYLKYNKEADRFSIDGILYKSFGDTSAAQMLQDDAWVTVILKRITEQTGHPDAYENPT